MSVSDTHLPDRVLVAAALLVAVAAVGVPAVLNYDAWAWSVWGRELGRLDLDTTRGPSWKPLPVLVTALLAPLGSLAVPAFAVIVRAGALLAVAAVYRMAARMAGPVAGVLAAGALVLTPDGEPRFVRLVAESHPAPLSAALVLFALEAHLRGRHRRALALVWALALLRPEAWPFLALHALWLSWRSHVPRRLVAAVLASVPLLWFGMDWWGSGDPFHGADTAQVLQAVPPLERLSEGLSVAWSMVPVPVWAGAAVAVVVARRRSDPLPQWIAAGALAWSAIVVAMAATLGYAAISRFFVPAAALVCVLGAVGVVQALRWLRRDAGRWTTPAVIGVVVVAAAACVPRAMGIPAVLDEVRERARLEDQLDRTIELAGGREVLAACGEVAMTGEALLRPSVAWKLDLPLSAVQRGLPDGTGGAIVRAGGPSEPILVDHPGATVVGRTDDWVAAVVNCPRALGGG